MILRLIRTGIAGIFPLAGTVAVACPLCLSAFPLTISLQDLNDAQRAVLAMPVGDGKGYRVVAAIKGTERVGDVIAGTVFRTESGAGSERPLLLLREDRWATWVGFGQTNPANADWLRQVAAMSRPPADGDDAGWHAQLAYFLPHMDSGDAMVADIATSVLGRAPYRALRQLKADIDPAGIRRAVDDPALARQRSVRILLLGIAGRPADAAWVDETLAAERRAQHSHEVGALLAATLEFKGVPGLPWVERTYLLDPKRTRPEVEAALLALSVQGGADATIPRRLVIDSYRRLMRERKSLAGLVAVDLAAWDDWSAASEYLALLKGNAMQDPASRYAAISYLLRSPDVRDRTAVKALGLAP